MKKFLLGLTLIPTLIFASDFPAPQGPVNDFAQVLDARMEKGLTAVFTQLEKQTGIAMVIATLPSLEGADIETVAADLYQQWGIGKKGEDQGILMLAAIEDRNARIEVGYGLEGVIPDAFAGRVLREVMFPRFREGQYGAGFFDASLILIQRLEEKLEFQLKAGTIPHSPRRRQESLLALLPWPVKIFLGLGLLFLFFRHPWLLFFIPWSGRGFRGGGFGGGFGGFGGGLSGGGGASGRW
ncbi:MAG: TPM domain-containing protein [Deltaproteobacteria bacterium]|nr:TPM domain-containing protein [Deltaproteobacteria bacterium]